MSDFGSMSRESKKDKLRRQIVRPQQPAWNADPEEDSEAVVRKAHNRVLRTTADARSGRKVTK